MNAEIICVGTELLLGKVVNTNVTTIAKELAATGINVLYMSTIGDNVDRLKETIKTALNRSDLVILNGGLGPTKDDLTKEMAAEVTNDELFLDEECLELLKTQIANINENQLKQVRFPKNSTIFKNNNGTAPGYAYTYNNKIIMLLPGPPRELIPMLSESAIPYLFKDTNGIIESFNIKVYGQGEGPVSEIISDLLDSSNPTVATYALTGEMYIRISAKSTDSESAKELCKPVMNEIQKRLGDHIYGINVQNLESEVVRLLKDNNLTISTCESCTGGLLSKRITDISGSSSIFKTGFITYSNETKTKLVNVNEEILNTYGSVSEQTAIEMAKGCLKQTNSNIAVSITGVAGPSTDEKDNPVGLIYVCLTDGTNTYVLKRNPRKLYLSREFIRLQASNLALDMIRRYILKLDVLKLNEE